MVILQKIKNSELVCNNCNTARFVTDDVIGEIICSNCGFVVSDKIEHRGTENRKSSSETDNSRTGPGLSPKMYDKGLSTIIGVQNRDSVGKPISINNVQSFSRLRKWDRRSQIKGSSSRNLRIALEELNKVQSKMGLSSTVTERAALFYRKAVEKGLIRGRSVKAIAGACLYASCRDLEHPRTLIEISKQMEIGRNDLAKAYRTLFRELGFLVTVADPMKSITKMASMMKLKEKTVRKAAHILDLAHDAGIIAGKNPEVIAASIIYAACVITGENKSQREVSLVSDISTVSIRSRVSELREKLDVFSQNT